MLKQIPTNFSLSRQDRDGHIEEAYAIPLRLVPIATGSMVTARGLIQVLADADSPLRAHTLLGGNAHPHSLPPKHWQSLAQSIKSGGALTEAGLPAACFVWFDHLDNACDVYFAPDRRESGWTAGERELMEISQSAFIEESLANNLLEGFERFFDGPTELQPQAQQEKASHTGTGKRWTPEALRELADYRARHGTKKAAEHFRIAAQRVRALLPKEEKPKKANYFPTPKP